MNNSKILALIAGFAACAFGQTGKYTADWANTADCPLKILGAGNAISNGKADIFGQVTLGNSSAKQITSAGLAWSIESGGFSTAVFGFGPPITLNLAPGEVVATGGQGADAAAIFKILGATPSTTGSVTLAVVVLTFSDGTEWKRELSSARRFRNTEPAEIYTQFAQKLEQLATELRAGVDPSKKKAQR
jgi:hypothetical protein